MPVFSPMSDPLLERLAEVLQALASPRRLALVQTLRHGPASVGELVQSLGISEPVASKHLSQLRSAGFLQRRKVGNAVEYALLDPEVLDFLSHLHARLRKESAEKLKLLEGRG